MNGIVFASDRAGWIWAGRNTILASTDSGATWSVLRTNLSGPDTDIARLSFIDDSRGWAAGSLGHRPSIWKSEDGGRSWSLRCEWPRAFADSLGAILDIQFVDQSRGWAVGFNGLSAMIVATTDGGEHWKLQYSGSEITSQFRQVRFSDSRHGWALSYEAVMQTQDGGESWKLRYFDKGTLNSIDATSESDVWLAGAWGYLLHTRNGVRWSEVRFSGSLGASYLGHVKFTGQGLGWAWGAKCDIAMTRDFGKTWAQEPCPLDPPLRSEITTGQMVATSSRLLMIANPGRVLVRSIE